MRSPRKRVRKGHTELMSLYVWATVYACHHDTAQAGNHDMAWEAERGTAWLVTGSSAQQHPRSVQRCTPACTDLTCRSAFLSVSAVRGLGLETKTDEWESFFCLFVLSLYGRKKHGPTYAGTWEEELSLFNYM